MTTETGNEDRIRRAVNDAVDGLAGPDRGRLARIERELLQRSKRGRSARWSWIVLGAGLAAGAAAAYWGVYGGATDTEDAATIKAIEAPSATGAGATGAKPAQENDEDRAGSDSGGESPVIYIGQ